MRPSDLHKVIRFHGTLLDDQPRLRAFRSAIQKVVRPGDTVIDIGAGTGVLSMFCCAAGAKRVYAIEEGHIIELARQLAHANGYEDKIVFIPASSFSTQLSERADVLVSETLGNLGFDEAIIPVVMDAKKRLLKPDARIIPESVELFAVPVQVGALYKCLTPGKVLGLDFSIFSKVARSESANYRFEPKQMLAKPVSLGNLLLADATEDRYRGEAMVTITRTSTSEGLACTFRSLLAGRIATDNRVGGTTTNWLQIFLPFERPQRFKRGQKITIRLEVWDKGLMWRYSLETLGRKIEHTNERDLIAA